ncbi:MAG TPA: hypothetical protein EYP49_13575 [Anaerolineae bacterium]|nr:hypothetical protein [Anaerolineae bacterium]
MVYDSLDDFEKDLSWIIEGNAPSGEFLAYLDFKKLSRREAQFSFSIEYWDTSLLFARAELELVPYGVRIHNYVYQYELGGETVFRYDDAPHFPRHPTFPHHKHIGPDETSYPCYQPSVEDVLKEIEAVLAGGRPTIPVVTWLF